MSITYDVFRGSPEGRIVADKTTRTLEDHEVFIETTHSGICGSDEHYFKAGNVLGHEGIGIIKALGPGVKSVKVGDRVGFGYTHSICTTCEECTTGYEQYCANQKMYGFHDRDNGSFSYGAVWDVNCVFLIPDGIDSVHAAPLMCAGASVWEIFMQYGVRPTDRVGIMGIGGLGHIAIKLAAAMGCSVVVLSSSEDKRQEAMDYGASEFHVYRSGGPPPEGFKQVKHLLLCGSGDVEFAALMPLMTPRGSIYPLTVTIKPATLPLVPLFLRGIRVQGSLLASRQNIRSVLQFAARKNITPTTMTFPMTVEGIEDAMQTLRDGKMRYRGVLVRDMQ
ncbi:NAD(P)-dependent alcohol dehydrogenase [Aspergillus homomorphus CBS 101889]|uniref:Alcohol dehydrogenase n=1 Tax=Aspergillus homomorphus (strain CBS 101889) TaxID=1450537 RepID=A0A395HKJ1_ASPHC|nr:alcohol dehydrogenase [Aspergillus homomorphus CBS 101889]RAL08451.1 alcohol dehydrogenase [Aspergillus homomorphus CBS 101889]